MVDRESLKTFFITDPDRDGTTVTKGSLATAVIVATALYIAVLMAAVAFRAVFGG
jgi:hypothetical protein